jgi:ribose transport system permease protein
MSTHELIASNDTGEAIDGASRPRARWRWGSSGQLLSKYALILVWAMLAVTYAVLMPNSFANTTTFQAIFGSQSALLILALAALATLVTGEFDLSFASVMGLAATIVPVLTTLHGVPTWLSCVIGLASAAACGLINAFFVVVLDVPSLVVTLGSASFFLGICEFLSTTSVGLSDPGFSELVVHRVWGLPLSFYYGVGLSLLFAYVMTWTPLGRHIAFVGANRDVARLAGINVPVIRAASYVVAGLLAGLAGLVIVASIGAFDPAAGSVYLLPSIAAVFLGSAVVQPGQFNPIGTLIGIYFLATGVIGLQLLGYTGWVQNAFYGGGLVLAVSVSAVVRRRVGVG